MTRQDLNELRQVIFAAGPRALLIKKQRFQSRIDLNNRRIEAIASKHRFAPSINPASINPANAITTSRTVRDSGTDNDLPLGFLGRPKIKEFSINEFLTPEQIARRDFQSRGDDPDFLGGLGATDRPGSVITRFFGRPTVDPVLKEAEKP